MSDQTVTITAHPAERRWVRGLLAGLIISAVYGRTDAAIPQKADVVAVQGDKISS